MNIYDFSVPAASGEEIPLNDYRGKVILIVNTATGCGFTPQYEALEEMYEALHEKGLEIIDVPCNQFGAQTPGSDDEIREFCTLKYNTQFPQMKKSDVNGDDELPLYTFLKEKKGFEGFGLSPAGVMMSGMLTVSKPDFRKTADIKWNFTKFVVDREGNVVARFEPTADMKDVRKLVEELIG